MGQSSAVECRSTYCKGWLSTKDHSVDTYMTDSKVFFSHQKHFANWIALPTSSIQIISPSIAQHFWMLQWIMEYISLPYFVSHTISHHHHHHHYHSDSLPMSWLNISCFSLLSEFSFHLSLHRISWQSITCQNHRCMNGKLDIRKCISHLSSNDLLVKWRT